MANATAMAVLLGTVLLLGACSGDNTADDLAQAAQYLDSGQFRSATITLKNVLQDEPKNARAWFVLGRVSLVQGQYADAAHQFRRARDTGTAQPQVARLLARALIGSGHFGEALDVLGPLTSDGAGERAQIHVLQGRAYLGLEQRQQARQAFAAALQAQPNDAAALVGQARMAAHAGKADQAQKLLARALDADSTYARAWVIAGDLAYRQRRCDDVAAVFAHIQAMKAHAVTPAQRFNARAHTAFCQLRQGQLDQAAANIDVLLKRGPGNPYANYLSGLLAYMQHNYDQATMHVQKVLAEAPDNVSGLVLSGMIKAAQGDLKGAQFQFAAAVTRAPDSLRARQLLASIYMRRELPEQAVRILREALGRHDTNARLLAQLGAASIRAGQRAKGLRYLHHSARYAVGDDRMQMALVRHMAQAGDVTSALALLTKMQSRGGRDVVKFELLKTALYLQDEQFDKAITETQALVRKFPDKIKFVRLLARIYISAGQQAKARSTLNKALQTAPENAGLRLDLGRIAMNNGDYETAQANFKAVHDAHPDNVHALMALGRSAVRRGQRMQAGNWFQQAAGLRPESIPIRVVLVRNYLARGRTDDALRVIAALVSDAPDKAGLYWLQSVALTLAGRGKDALASLKKAVALAPDTLALRLDLARLLLTQGQLIAATGELRQIREQYPGSLPATTMLAHALLRQGQARAALQVAKSLRDNGQHTAHSYVLVGELLQAQDKYEQAAAAYAKAYAKRPGRELALRLYGNRRRAGLSHPEQSLLAWLGTHPHDTRVMTALAQWYQSTGAYEAAAERYRSLLAEEPSNTIALNNLALLYLAHGDVDKAVKLAQRARAAAPRNAAVMDTLGWVLVHKGNVDKGLPLLQQAAQAMPSPQVRYHLAVALSQSGSVDHVAQAVSILEALLALERPFPGRADAMRLLKRIKK